MKHVDETRGRADDDSWRSAMSLMVAGLRAETHADPPGFILAKDVQYPRETTWLLIETDPTLSSLGERPNDY